MQTMGKLSLYCFLLISILLTGCAPSDARPTLFRTASQDATTYLDPATQNSLLVSPEEQQKLSKEYFVHYFSPWTGQDRLNNDVEIKWMVMEELNHWKKLPAFGDNNLLYDKKWINNIASNIDLATYPNRRIKGITISQASIRTLPTTDPVFSKSIYAQGGYPFDRLQSQVVSAGLPVLILQMTKDGAYSLIQTHNNVGWVPSNSVASVDKAFIKQWKGKNYISIIKNQISVFDANQRFLFTARAGSVYPLAGTTENAYIIQVPVMDNKHAAVVSTSVIPKGDAREMPLPLTAANIATILNQYMGYPYGWGETYGYRDCSSTMMDLFTPFAVWLPRDSGSQAQTGKYTPFTQMSNTEKLQKLQTKAIPFLTLLSLPGHIVLYLGEKDGKYYIFHDVWSLGTRFKGQVLLTQTVITPIDFGKQYINVPRTFIDNIKGMTIP